MSDSVPHPEELSVHAAFLTRLARGLLRSPDLADDAVQETLVLAWKKRPDGPHPRGWMAKTLRNVARNLRRGSSRRGRHEERATPRQQASPDAIRERERLRTQLLDVVLALPEPTRDVVLLRFDQGLPPRRIATALGIPVHAVHNRLRSGMARLRRDLAQELGSEADADGGWRGALAALIPTLTPASATPLMLGGLLMSKAAWLISAALFLLAVGWVVIDPLGDDTPPDPDGIALSQGRLEAGDAKAAGAGLRGLDRQPEDDLSAAAREMKQLHGVVHEAGSGAVVSGARVRAFDFQSMRTLETTTRADGTFVFPDTQNAGGAFHIRVDGEALAPADVSRALARAAPHRIAMLGGGWLEGSVALASGDARPADLRVRSILRRYLGDGIDPALKLVEAALPASFRPRTKVDVDAETGRFRLGPLAPGKHALEFLRPGRPLYQVVPEGTKYAWEGGFDVPAGQTVDVGEIALLPDGELLVHLIDARTEATLPRATFESYSEGGIYEERFLLEILGRTEQGLFRLPARGTGKHRISLNAMAHVDGYASAEVDISGTWGTRPLVIRMHRDASVAGRVITGLGDPGVGIAYLRRSSDEELLAAVPLDAEGQFTAAGLPAGVVIEVLVFGQDLNGRQHAQRLTLNPGEHRELTLGGATQTAVKGIVRRSGQPVPGVLISVDDVAGDRIRIWTGSDGRFRVDGLRPGYATVFWNLGEATAMVTQRVKMVEGETIDVSLDLVHEVRGRVVLEGRLAEGDTQMPGVRFRTGDPLQGGVDVEVRTDAAGAFKSWLPRAGGYVLLSEDADYFVVSPGSVQIQDGENGPFQVQMAKDPSDGEITFRVVDGKTKQPASGATLSYSASQRSGMATQTRVGVVLLENARLGRYRCRLQAPGYVSVAVRVEITPDTKKQALVVPLAKSQTVVISSFTTGSRGQAAGMRQGDAIRSYDGKPVTDLRSLRAAMANQKNTDLVPVMIQRGQQELKLDVPGGRLGVFLANGLLP